VESGIHSCAAYAVNRWAAATEPVVDSSTTSDAEVLCALSLFRECVAVSSAHGEVDTCHRQGLTLVHFSDQPEPLLTQNTPQTSPDTP